MSTLEAGTRLGPYQIDSALGEGGMGEVYRATDTRLDREVAIKVLPPHWADDPAMKERFDREAQAIASLNHPHICALHDVGEHDGVAFLVMECLEGETLAERLAAGALDINDALDIAIPVLDALDQAHQRGVIHRDLKPSNVMLTESGPKLLDFGIAKTLADAAPGAGDTGTQAGTVAGAPVPNPTSPLTTPGLVLGTLQYMAPEQLDGLEADARTDIFAFGALLHEMISGAPAFVGDSQALLISSIATSDPAPLTTTQPETPPALEHVVKTCVAKSPDDRWQSARDLLAELRWIAEGGAAADGVALVSDTTGGSWRRVATMGLAAAVVLAVAASGLFVLRPTSEAAEVRYRLASPVSFNPAVDDGGYFALSPDGDSVAIAGVLGRGAFALYTRELNALVYEHFPGTEGAAQPFWSADGRDIGFVMRGKLMRVAATGGPPQEICDASDFRGGTWNESGTILFGTAAGIFRVSAEGGSPESVTTPAENEAGHFWPHFLPDGRRFLYLAWSTDAGARALFAGALDDDERTRIMPAESNARFTVAGNLIFHRQGTVYTQPLDNAAMALTGEPVRIADEVLFSSVHGRAHFDVGPEGTLAYQDANTSTQRFGSGFDLPLQLTWIEWSGQQPATVGDAATYRGAEVAPDGMRIAVHRHDVDGGDVWVIEPGGERRISFDPTQDNSLPIWSPDGADLVFSSRRDGKWGLYRKPANGAGADELLYESDELKAATSWAPDGTHLVFWMESSQSNGDIWLLPLDGAGEPEPLVASPADEKHGQISPDGKWLAYASNQTDAETHEIYVQPFPTGPGLYQVSTDGGDWPRWSPDSSKLYFLPPSPPDTAFRSVISSVDITVDGTALTHESPRPVIRILAPNPTHPGGLYPVYAVSPDGGRVLVSQMSPPPLVQAQTGASALGPDDPDLAAAIVVVRNWEANLGRR